MNGKLHAVSDALVAAALVSVILAICLTAGDYLALIAGEHLLERWAVLPVGWGETHLPTLRVWAFAIALAPTAFVAWWIFRSGRRYGDHPS